MLSLLRFSLLLSLSVVDFNEKMAKFAIKSHKEPPDHKMDIKVVLHLDHVLDGDVHSPAADPSAPRSTLCQHLSEPLSSIFVLNVEPEGQRRLDKP